MSISFFTSFMSSLWNLFRSINISVLGYNISLSNVFIASVGVSLVFYLIFYLIKIR